MNKQVAIAQADEFSIASNRDEKFVARYFGVDVETVRGWRKRNIGPRWRKIGGKLIRYSITDLIEWAQKQPGGGATA